jgi:hypothetical protein
MKRIRVIGLALIAVCAVGAISVSAASAMIEKAEFKKAGTKNGFTGKSKLPLEPTLYANSVLQIRCRMDTSKGLINPNNPMIVDKVSIVFTECRSPLSGGCAIKSTGAPHSNLIATTELDGELKRVLPTEATTEVGIEFLPEVGTAFVDLEGSCLSGGGSNITGKIVGEVTPINKSQLTSEQVFKTNAFNEQVIEKTCLLALTGTEAGKFGTSPCGPKGERLDEPALNAFGLETAEMTTEELTFEENTEVKTS